MTPNWRGAGGKANMLKGSVVFQRKLSKSEGWARKDLMQFNTKSCSWEGRPPGSYRLGAEGLGSSSGVLVGTRRDMSQQRALAPRAPSSTPGCISNSTALKSKEGTVPLECCLQLGLPVEKRLGQTKASPRLPPGWSGWEQWLYEKVLGELGLLWGPSSCLPFPTGRLLSPRTPAFLRRVRDSGWETQEVQAGPSGQEVKQVVQGGHAVSNLGGLSRKSPELPALISYLTML